MSTHDARFAHLLNSGSGLPDGDGLIALSRNASYSEVADAPGTVATPYSMSVGDLFDGRIGSVSDTDWIRIDLQGGQSYVFTVWGRGGSVQGIDNTTLQVMDANGNSLAINYDIEPGSNAFSGIKFVAPDSGTYYLSVQGAGGHFGNYRVQAASDVYTLDQVVTQLTEYNWGIPTEIAHNVTVGGTITYNISGLNAAGQQLARWAMEAWSIATGITFVESTSPGARIVLDDSSPGSFAGPSALDPVTGIIYSATVNIGTAWVAAYGKEVGSYSFLTYLHEIGHALGLGHAGPYDGNAAYGRDALYANDSYQMTIMSYFSQTDNTRIDASYALPITPMVGDIAAVEALYGRPNAAYAGNTVWGANSNVGGYLGLVFGYLFNGVTPNPAIYNGGPVAFTIQDSGGIDTIDMSTQTRAQRIDLRPEGISNLGDLIGNAVIARGTVIENAIGGSGADTIIGNDAANVLRGGRGGDVIDGGAGTDTVIINANRLGAVVTEVNGQIRIVTADGTDLVSNVELFQFNDGTVTLAQLLGAPVGSIDGGPGPDSLPGTTGDDTIYGFAGEDRLEGLAGNDMLYGGADNDAILGHGGHDSIYGGDGDDTIAASDGNDLVNGDDGNDDIGGGQGMDTIYGGGGNDTMGSGTQADRIYGGDGDDVASGGWGSDSIWGDAGNDTLAGSFDADTVYGGAGDDAIGGGTGADYLYGGDGNDNIGAGDDDDFLYGDVGDDFLGGGNGNDQLFGGDGADRLNGGLGNDTMTGGAGADRFIFSAFTPGEVDRITRFEDGVDKFQLSGIAGVGLQAKFDALSISSVKGGVNIGYDGHVIFVQGASLAQIDKFDFIFV